MDLWDYFGIFTFVVARIIVFFQVGGLFVTTHRVVALSPQLVVVNPQATYGFLALRTQHDNKKRTRREQEYKK